MPDEYTERDKYIGKVQDFCRRNGLPFTLESAVVAMLKLGLIHECNCGGGECANATQK